MKTPIPLPRLQQGELTAKELASSLSRDRQDSPRFNSFNIRTKNIRPEVFPKSFHADYERELDGYLKGVSVFVTTNSGRCTD